jgi:glucose dehydrogenase
VVRPKPGEWPTYHGNESGNRLSPLDQIGTGNVERLVPQWMFPVPGVARALEVTAANEAYALDARNGRRQSFAHSWS